ncbi:D-alanyl-D-alanine carboxypeptidase family protein [Methylobacterium sp. Leaf466]|uniref:D-alanyl-D-alanine carboxypeptidase family protein n=1 Tax=Methylobacterium sp. Leaf466 TaxID=1736386 RepID=UPI0006F92576|nr:D-alanyl-D-alanine carboxypeptidase family protein [Methylobacterium sp. Leaf466]KQT78921.1 D-alanyl-D-alanine carboxypeptidase [Methylobacterium sp. Leaf466]
MSNRFLRRFVLGLTAGAGLFAPCAAQAVTAPMLVVDVDSGKVIHAQGATDPWFPASVTKLMTAYVALDMVRQGKVSLDSLITISPQAAAEPPSKMGFKPGTQLTLDNALKIIMVKSANDVAYAIGENLGGSVEGFAAAMNETAQRIGMRESRWTNPHGLPDPRQWTTARDMAVLGRALIRDFPDSRPLFSISAIQFGRSVMANHNGLLGRYAGTDGMKTGFICSGGFNVVASATRNGRRIITVVMGQPSARERDIKAADLFDYGFTQSPGWGAATLETLPTSAISEPPDMRPYICDRRKPMPVDSGQAAVVAGGAADQANTQLMASVSPLPAALAFATMNSAALRNRALPPRAPLQPILVWIGRDPAEGAIALSQQEDADKAEKAAARTAKLEEAKAKREAAREAKQAKTRATQDKPASSTAKATVKTRPGTPASASAYTAVETTPVLAGGAKVKAEAVKPAKPNAAKATPAKATPAKPAAKAGDKKPEKPGTTKAAAGRGARD